MKKLMFAAVAAAMAAVASADCGLPTPGATCGLPVWDFQVVLRADSYCQCLAADQAQQAANACGVGGQAAANVCVNWRVLETRAFSGLMFVCACSTCSEWQNGLNVALYDVTRGVRYYSGLAGSTTPTLTFGSLYRFGLRGEQVAALGTLAFTDPRGGNAANLQLAGHGAFPWNDINLQYPSYIAGFVTGTLGDAFSCDTSVALSPCNYYALCTDTSSVNNLQTLMGLVEANPVFDAVAYGQFAIQLNVAKSAALKESKYTDPADGTEKYNPASILPAWFLQ